MIRMQSLKVGLVSSSQLSFPGDKKSVYEASAQKLRALSGQLGFELYVHPGTVITPDDGYAAVKALEGEGVDFILLQCTSFSAGALAPIFARARAALGLWAIPEHADHGVLPFNSFCTINMYSGIIGHYLKDYNIPIKWFFGDVEDPLFRGRLAVTVRALRAIKNLKASKVALIGGIAPGFDDLYDDERTLIRRFDGIRINRLHEYSEVRDRAVAYSAAQVSAEMERIAAEAGGVLNRRADETLETNARFSLAYDDFIKEYGYDAIAVSCWPKFQDEFQYSVCAVVGGLNDKGIPTACEGDLTSAISMLLLKYLSDDVGMLMDMGAFDQADDTVLMWHCGPAASRFCRQNGYRLSVNYHGMAHEEGAKEPNCCGVTRDMVFDPGEVTIARISGEADELLVANGSFLGDTKPSFYGSRGWLGGLSLNGTPIGALDLVNTLLVRRFSHHFPIVRGDYSKELLEAMGWLGMKKIEPVPYADYLQSPNW